MFGTIFVPNKLNSSGTILRVSVMEYLRRKPGCFGSGIRKRLSLLLPFVLLIVLTAGLVLNGCGQAGAAAGGETTDLAVSAVSSQQDLGGGLTEAEEYSSADRSAEESAALRGGAENEESNVDNSSPQAAEEISSSAETAKEAGEKAASSPGDAAKSDLPELADDGLSVTEDGEYTSRDEVAAYLHAFGHLPSNYITKRKAEAAGWDPKAGNLWEVAPGKSIGGSRFGNYEGSLPEADGRKYFECDIDYDGGSRNAKRIVYSSDGLIFYTDDHYRTFERLY